MTYEEILQRMLDRVPNAMDKREGSIIYDALAPAAAELAQMHVTLKSYLDLVFVDTSSEDYLTRLCTQFGIEREEATQAVRKVVLEGISEIPIGSRFSIDSLFFVATEKIADFEYKAKCETSGTIGNKVFGKLTPITYIQGLSSATLTDVLIPGEEIETDEELKNRYFEYVREPAFGGNIADYKRKVKSLDGVGQVKVFPVWNGAGTVKLVLLDSDFNVPTPTLIQNVTDAVKGDGGGLGIAPIGHYVTILPTSGESINFEFTGLRLKDSYNSSEVEENITKSLEDYLLSLRKEWESNDKTLVRVAYIEYRALDVEGVLDLNEVLINGSRANLEVTEESIPILGSVVFDYAT